MILYAIENWLEAILVYLTKLNKKLTKNDLKIKQWPQ